MSDPPKPVLVNRGVQRLADQLGISASTVSYKLRLGKTPEQIRDEAEVRKQRLSRGIGVPGRLPGYTPGLPNSAIFLKPSEPSAEPAEQAEQPAEYRSSKGVGLGSGRPPEERAAATGVVPNGKANSQTNGYTNGHSAGYSNSNYSDPNESARSHAWNLAAENLRKVKEQADELALKNAHRRGELVEWAAVKLHVISMITEAVAWFSRLPSEQKDRLAAETDPAVLEQMLDEAIRAVLKTLSIERLEEEIRK